MYTLQIVTPPSTEPVTTAELKAALRLNTTAEDSLLTDYITTARTMFETMTNRPVIATVYKQWFTSFNGPIYLIRGGVTSIASLNYYDQTDTLQTVSGSDWDSDLTGLVPSVFLKSNNYPVTSTKKVPVGYVQYTAGWANAGATDVPVKVAIKLLAGHFFKNRTAYEEKSLSEVPMGFKAICDQYRTGLISQMGHEGYHHWHNQHNNNCYPWGY